jgi:1-deoxy-D-xylulose-5-phosphate reductoisomerase
MGRKITIDSATLMNKGLEVIEAHWLFDVPFEDIQVVVHPQSAIHSMVEYIDSSVIAEIGVPDMRIPIAYALSYPERVPIEVPKINLFELGAFTFEAPDMERFPCLRYAYEAGEIGGTMPVVLNAANEVAVDAFLRKRIGFMEIAGAIRQVMEAHSVQALKTLEDAVNADHWARTEAEKWIEE